MASFYGGPNYPTYDMVSSKDALEVWIKTTYVNVEKDDELLPTIERFVI